MKQVPPRFDHIDARETRAQARERRERVMERDGTSRVVRLGSSGEDDFDLYHVFMASPWWLFFLGLFIAYLATNVVFGALYWLVRDQIDNVSTPMEAFFFSVQTLASIGYGHAAPIGTMANILVTIESFVGMVWISIGAGLVFARVTRPKAGVLFSEKAVITVHDGEPVLMFRMANRHRAHIVEAHVHVVMAYDDVTLEGEHMRRLVDLNLRRNMSPSFSLSWTVRHPINTESPLFGKNAADLDTSRAEILVVFAGFHENFNQNVHARRVYAAEDIHWNHKLVDIFVTTADGRPGLDFSRFHGIEPDV